MKLKNVQFSSVFFRHGLHVIVLILFRPRGCHGDRGRKDFSASSSEEEQTVAPSLSLLSLPSFKDVGNDSGGEKEVWVSVFTYLNRAELLACMTVCKAWYKWYVSHTQPNNSSLSQHYWACFISFYSWTLVSGPRCCL